MRMLEHIAMVDYDVNAFANVHDALTYARTHEWMKHAAVNETLS